jgi:CRISPR-associated protein Cas1
MQVIELNKSGIAITVKGGFLIVKQEEQTEQHDLDNIDCLIINSYGAIFSNQALIRLCELNIPLLVCGKNAVPIGILQANTENVYRKTHLTAQLNASQPLLKNLWQKVIKAKVRNQAMLLKANKQKHNDITLLIGKVTSGDSGNVEAIAARFYWQRLFGKGFKRDFEQPGINAFLNYSYALLRASFCRHISASGLLPESGIHHRNAMNPFCLADDLMEPYRPFADELVKAVNTGDTELTPAAKKQLITLLDRPVNMNGNNYHLQFCIQRTVQTAVNSFLQKKCLLEYPELDA